MYISALFPLLQSSITPTGDHTAIISLEPSSFDASSPHPKYLPRSYTIDYNFPYPESEQLAFKPILPADSFTMLKFIEKSLSIHFNSFLNSAGGLLFLGISQEGIVQGAQLTRRFRDDIRCSLSSLLVSSLPRLYRHHAEISLIPVLRDKFHIPDTYVIVLGVCYNRIKVDTNGPLFLTDWGKTFVRQYINDMWANIVIKLPNIEAPPLSTSEIDVVQRNSSHLGYRTDLIDENHTETVAKNYYNSITRAFLSECLRKYRLTFVKGHGKSTIIPQMIVDNEQGLSKEFGKIIVVKRHGLWAVQNATYLCSLRGWTLGTDVGIITRKLKKYSDVCPIVYITYSSFLNFVKTESFLSFGFVLFDDFHFFDFSMNLAFGLF
ncbi:hypothetical protein GEMRC1_011838 [Eukaryota sp. GEM-RC1]